MEIVLSLARENQLDEKETEPELVAERQLQQEAMDLVEDFTVNYLGDD